MVTVSSLHERRLLPPHHPRGGPDGVRFQVFELGLVYRTVAAGFSEGEMVSW